MPPVTQATRLSLPSMGFSEDGFDILPLSFNEKRSNKDNESNFREELHNKAWDAKEQDIKIDEVRRLEYQKRMGCKKSEHTVYETDYMPQYIRARSAPHRHAIATSCALHAYSDPHMFKTRNSDEIDLSDSARVHRVTKNDEIKYTKGRKPIPPSTLRPMRPNRKLNSSRCHGHSSNNNTLYRTLTSFDNIRSSRKGAYCCCFFNNAESIAVGLCGATLRLHRCESGEVYGLASLRDHSVSEKPLSEALPLTCLLPVPHNAHILLAGCSSGKLTAWNAERRNILHSVQEENNEIYALDFNAEGTHFASAGADGMVRLYDAKTYQQVTHYGGMPIFGWGRRGMITHAGRILSLRFHPSEHNIAVTGGLDRQLKVWDVRMWHAVKTITGPNVCGDSIDLHNQSILVGSYSSINSLQMFDLGSGHLVQHRSFTDHYGNPLTALCARFSKGDTSGQDLVIGGGGSNEAYVCNSRTLQVLQSVGGFTQPIQAVDFSHDSQLLAISSVNEQIKILSRNDSQ